MIKVSGRDATELGMQGVRDLLREDGASLIFLVRRGSKEQKVEVLLARLV